MVFQEGHYCISCHSHTGHYLTDTMAILHDRHISEEVAHASSRKGCAHITKRHEFLPFSTSKGSRCRLIPVLSGLQECNYVTLQYK